MPNNDFISNILEIKDLIIQMWNLHLKIYVFPSN